LQDIGLLPVTESQCTEEEHDDEDDSKFRAPESLVPICNS